MISNQLPTLTQKNPIFFGPLPCDYYFCTCCFARLWSVSSRRARRSERADGNCKELIVLYPTQGEWIDMNCEVRGGLASPWIEIRDTEAFNWSFMRLQSFIKPSGQRSGGQPFKQQWCLSQRRSGRFLIALLGPVNHKAAFTVKRRGPIRKPESHTFFLVTVVLWWHGRVLRWSYCDQGRGGVRAWVSLSVKSLKSFEGNEARNARNARKARNLVLDRIVMTIWPVLSLLVFPKPIVLYCFLWLLQFLWHGLQI